MTAGPHYHCVRAGRHQFREGLGSKFSRTSLKFNYICADNKKMDVDQHQSLYLEKEGHNASANQQYTL